MLTGSCACGSVTYEIRGALFGPVNHCHCWRCRKQSGASFGTSCSMHRADFVVRTGEAQLRAWESSPGIHRFFASCCGSPIYKADDSAPEELRLRLGTLDANPRIEIDRHYMAGSKAPWVTLDDALPREENGPPFGEKD